MANGVKFGRKPKLSPYQRAEAIKRREAGETLASIARSYAVDLRSCSHPIGGLSVGGLGAWSAALAQPTDGPSDHEHGQQERDDHAHADEHIGENDSGAVIDGHGARKRFAINASVRSVERIASPVHASAALIGRPKNNRCL
jgi:hypothetical protein